MDCYCLYCTCSLLLIVICAEAISAICSVFNNSRCVQHATECSRSVGFVLHLSSTLVLVVSGRRYAFWGSLYLDEHGEEDRNLIRGRPLFLSAARFRLLELQWRAHAFDCLCKPFHWHFDKL